ncbi:NAD(P)/FAD-dependent oxidoreductase [Mariniflexile ostreae]|uniref:NAD(P)/FAD-dependent oxidoreductase n=1 Tax=Mariniflexile ostreae TaxID=1520892 RepID=A0ABV5FAY0_9FLAO
MDIRSNKPFWLVKNALAESYSALRVSLDTDVLIIGGGITGALMGYQMLKEGRQTILIDKRDVCHGSTAASTSMLQYEIDVPLHLLIEKRGLTCAVSSYQNCEKAIDKLKKISTEIKSNCQFNNKKSIYFCTSKKDKDFLLKEYNIRKAHGFKVAWLDSKSLNILGLKAYAAIESSSGAVMDAYKFAQDLLAFSSEKGLQVFDRTSADHIEFNKENIKVTTNHGTVIHAKHIINCTGYESTERLKETVVDLKSTYALASEAFAELPKPFKNHIYWNTSSPYHYFRSTADGRIIMGGGDEDFKNAKKRDALLPKKEKQLVKAFASYFPDIPFHLDYSWAGTFGETKDGLPYMGRPDLDKNEHYILGFGGNGITYSVMGMDAIASSLENKPHPYLEYYKFKR